MTTPTFATENCRSCAALIIWAETERGRSMPVDAQPSADGSIRLHAREQYRSPLAVVLPVAKRFGLTNLHTSHFATCPHAARWRQRGRAAS